MQFYGHVTGSRFLNSVAFTHELCICVSFRILEFRVMVLEDSFILFGTRSIITDDRFRLEI